MPFGTVVSQYGLRQSFYRKKSEIVEKIFPCSENAIWSILLKYQEIDVQIQASTDEN